MSGKHIGNLHPVNSTAFFLKWLFETVLLSLAPLIATAIISLMLTGSVKVLKICSDGDLIFAAFMISAPAMFRSTSLYELELNGLQRIAFYFLYFSSGLELILYGVVKAAKEPHGVVMSSLVLLLTSCISSYTCELIGAQEYKL